MTKLALSMWSYVRAWRRGDIDIPGFLEVAKGMGIAGVELLDVFFADDAKWMAQTKEVAHLARSMGMQLPIFSVSNDFTEEGKESYTRNLEKVQKGIERAVLLGAEVVRVFAGGGENVQDHQVAYARVVEGLSSASEYAKSRGVRLALENHGRFAGRGDQVITLIREVRAKTRTATLGSNPDPANFLLADEEPHSGVSMVAPVAYMAHLKDFAPAHEDKGHVFISMEGKRYVGVPLGDGIVPLRKCLQTLREAGFRGWVSVEYEAEEDERTGIPKSLAVARNILQDLWGRSVE
ncbi:MAG: sugar phosphate isomerase/epimerase family protein [Candidatus Caldarchaeum sp.]